MCEVKTLRRGSVELFSMKTLQHWPLHLLVCAASEASRPSRIRAQNDAPSRWPRQPLRTGRSEWRMQLDAVILDRIRRDPKCNLVEHSLGRAYPCPPRVRPAKTASRDVVLAQRQQGPCALHSPTHALNGQGPEKPRHVGEDQVPHRDTISDSSTVLSGVETKFDVVRRSGHSAAGFRVGKAMAILPISACYIAVQS